MKLTGYKLVVEERLVGHHTAVKIHNRLYISPAMNHLLEETKGSDKDFLLRNIPVLEMDQSSFFKYSIDQKRIDKLVAEGEDLLRAETT